MNHFFRFVEALSRWFGYFAAVLLGIAVLIVCHMVFVRFVLDGSTSWQTEFVTYTLLASTFLGAPWVLLKKGHVNVELVPLMLGPRARFFLSLVAYSISFALCAILTWYSFEFWYEAWEEDWSSDTIWGPKLWKIYLSMPIGFFLISLQYVVDILSLITGRCTPFGIADTETLLGAD